MATAANYPGTEIGLIWDTLLPGVIPVTLCVAVLKRATEDRAVLCCLCWFPTKQGSAPAGPVTVVSLSNTAFFTEMKHNPGAVIAPEPA